MALVCPQCRRVLRGARRLRLHLKLKHAHNNESASAVIRKAKKTVLKCSRCHKTFKGASGLAWHIANIHKKALTAAKHFKTLPKQETIKTRGPTSTVHISSTDESTQEAFQLGLAFDTENQAKDALEDFISLPRSFTVEEVVDFADSEADCAAVRTLALNDKRLFALGVEDHFILETALFRWFVDLNVGLAQIPITRMTAHQFAVKMSSLRVHSKWDTPSPEAVLFGQHFGLVAPACTPDEFMFPIAALLSRLSTRGFGIAVDLLYGLAEKDVRNLALDRSLESCIEEALLGFGNKQVTDIARGREGLLPGGKKTLEELGSQLGVTRERIRQVEAKFWDKVLGRSRRSLGNRAVPFVRPLLYEVIRHHGSAVYPADASHIRFSAKCIGLPVVEVPRTGLVLLGAEREDIKVLESLEWHTLMDAHVVAAYLELNPKLCLSSADMSLLSTRIAAFHKQHSSNLHRVYFTLQQIGKPAHYSKVAEIHNSLFPDHVLTERNIHAVLGREERDIVWVGLRGTFALRTWGYDRPSKPLFDTVTEIVQSKYAQTGRPVSFEVIAAEIGKHRQLIKMSSLSLAAYCNPELRRVSANLFVPKSTSDESQNEITADELDEILKDFEATHQTKSPS
ncbi:MAG: hypothetical protein HY663_05220 [Chloroflexi bacterium]|nr:hypothetical protein [Chloroflexota bacterium]